MRIFNAQIRTIFVTVFCFLIFQSCGGGSSSDDEDQMMETPTVSPVIAASDLAVSVDENPETGALLGTIPATVNTGSLQYNLTSQSLSGALSVGSSTGAVTVADASLFDFETVQSLTANIRISSGSVTKDIVVTVTITDVDESPVSYTIWTGTTLSFTKADGADPTDASNQDAITDLVKITRGNTGGQIYNIVSESVYNKNNSPLDTEWAIGTVDDIANLNFQSFRTATGGQPKVLRQNMVLHLITDDVYLSFKITSWSTQKAGGFSYERSTSN